MRKNVCDICGKDAPGTDFCIPSRNVAYATNNKGEKIAIFDHVVQKQVNLCLECQKYFASIFDFLCEGEKERTND